MIASLVVGAPVGRSETPTQPTGAPRIPSRFPPIATLGGFAATTCRPSGTDRGTMATIPDGDGREHSDALQRLKSARGHLDAVIGMLEDDRYCIDVLHQLRAVEGGLVRSRRSILERHLRTCVVDAYAEGRVDDVVDELLAAFFTDRAPAPRSVVGPRRGSR